MIIVGGGGGGGGVLLVMMLFFLVTFVLVPLLLLRTARRAVVLQTGDRRDGWVTWESGGWPAQGQGGGWDLPQEPVLPPVHAADVSSLRDRLGHDVRNLQPGDDPVARQAMADASERYSTCSALLERAGSQAQLRTAWLAAAEGLHAARLVRTRQGLDPGPEVPMPPSGPRLSEPSRFDVGGRTTVGGPTYAPGRPHWFPGGDYGGRYVPGGWYDVPFWPSALLLGGLGGWALGGLVGGAMYGEDLGWGGDGDGGFGGFGGGGGWSDGGGGWGDGGGGGGWGDGGWGGGDLGGGGGWGGGGGFGGGDGGGW